MKLNQFDWRGFIPGGTAALWVAFAWLVNFPIELIVVPAPLLALCLYLATRRGAEEIMKAPGLTEAEFSEFLEEANEALRTIAELNNKVSDPKVRGYFTEIISSCRNLVAYFERRPETILGIRGRFLGTLTDSVQVLEGILSLAGSGYREDLETLENIRSSLPEIVEYFLILNGQATRGERLRLTTQFGAMKRLAEAASVSDRPFNTVNARKENNQ